MATIAVGSKLHYHINPRYVDHDAWSGQKIKIPLVGTGHGLLRVGTGETDGQVL
jgi:hypothetical protein